MNDILVSLSHSSHSSSLNTQLLLSPVHPSVSKPSTSSGLLKKSVLLLSRISVMSDEVIGYKSPVIEVSSSVTADFHILLCSKVSDILGKLRDGTEVTPVGVKTVSITGNRWSDFVGDSYSTVPVCETLVVSLVVIVGYSKTLNF